MKIELHEMTVREVFNGYINNDEEGVTAYDSKLNIRPKYQREFVYKPQQMEAVINTISKGFPLNVIYWCKNSDNTYEVLDGQQRLISIGEYLRGAFAVDYRFFSNLFKDEVEQILNYKLMIYICEGKDSEKLAWFKTINIAGEKLTDQELRNAVYTGEWLSDAKKYFSKTSCPAFQIGSKYLNGSPIRQDYLETVIKWISNDNIEKYMAEHQQKPDANELWLYFQNVINWVKAIFPTYRKEMKGIEWGFLYNQFKDTPDLNKAKLEEEIIKLMQDDDVTNKKGIYYYVLTREESNLNVRAFSDSMKRAAYERQKGICTKCNEHFDIEQMHGDHITPWHLGGKTTAENCQMLCKDCNRRKGGK